MVRTPSARQVLWSAVATAALMLVTACGSTSSDAVGSTSTTPAPTTAAADTTPTGSVSTGTYSSGSHAVSWDVDGVTRTGMLVIPSGLSGPAPLVVAYHGHGGRGSSFQRKVDVEGLWPQAIVVYPDGLVGHKGRTDPEGVETGWQQLANDEGGRDLRFYDVMMADLRSQLPIDPQRIFVMGHSNGSAFTSLLLNTRGDQIAATANLSAQAGHFLDTDPVRSMFMSMGEQDPIVPYDNQKLSIPLAEAKLGVDPGSATVDGYLRIETGPGNLELDTYVHPDGHEVPDAVPPLVVAFFQRHSLADGHP
ncbi:MAG: alpha/beta hydrolase family esterase [Acidimicrobiales bacterium]